MDRTHFSFLANCLECGGWRTILVSRHSLYLDEEMEKPVWKSRCDKCEHYQKLRAHQVKRIPANWRKQQMWNLGVCIPSEERERRMRRLGGGNWSH